MNCNVELHNELEESGDIYCPFCDVKLQDCSVKHDLCCNLQDIINDNGMRVCQSCGVVHGYDFANKYIDFSENRSKMVRKSIYNRKYHLYNKADFLSSKNGVQISLKDKNKIIRIFNEIDKILPQINCDRKRMINIDFVLKQLFKMLDLPVEKNTPLSKSKRTLASYKQYWKDILLLIGDKIKSIVGTP